MILSIELESNEQMTNIGFAKAIIDKGVFRTWELDEIGDYLKLYSNARAKESLESLKCGVQFKGGAEF